MKKYIYIIALTLLNYSAIQAQIFSDDNFIYKVSPKKAVQASNFNLLTQDEMIQSITYFDGLGRAVQDIALRQGGTGEDIVTHMEYDAFGRQEKEFLPFAVVNPGSNQKKDNALNSVNAFYDTGKYENTLNAFSQKQYDGSPLNRVIKQAAPGNDWKLGAGHEIKIEYQNNIANEVRQFTANTRWDSGSGVYAISILGNNYYQAGMLYKTVTYDENTVAPLIETNGATVEFKNKEGQIVLKRTYGTVGTGTVNEKHDTYYIYDIYGNLTYVIPPKAADLIIGTGSTTIADANITSTATVTSANPLHLVATNSIRLLPGFIAQTGATFSAGIVDGGVDQITLDNLCYQYKYDYRNRLVEKKLPGKQWEYIIYDKLDRPILTQDGNLRAAKKWMFTKYDVFNRPVYTGEYTNLTHISRAEMQSLAGGSAVLFETKQGATVINGTTVYYSNNAFPNNNDANITLFTINYYDDYNFDLNGGVSEVSYGVNASVATKGLLTGSKILILGKSSWITSVNYYDDKARVIYSYSKNDFLLTTDKVKSKFDFTGTVLETTATHLRNGITTTIVDSFSYDQTNRLIKQTQAINGASVPEIIVANTYDDLGQLVSKKVGGTTPNGLQSVDFKYNIRGWLKNINDINAIGNDLFAFQINYNDIAATDKKLFNGNISQTLWKTANADSSIKNYVYSYDKLNRLTNAVDNLNKFSESLNYDKNGNITKLVRLGEIVGGSTIPNIANPSHFGIMDNLDYTYDAGNKLQIVSDSGNKTYGFKDDFTEPGADTTVDYTYDENGNMKTDTNKEITNIVYNHLNLPAQVTIAGKNIDYLYDATGIKQQKTVNNIVTDYAGGFIYENNELKFFSQPEGYIAKNANSFEYIYQYKDHLGNVRLSYDKNLAIQEENNYYPFGLKHKGYNNVNNLTAGNSTAQKYKYNGKELQDELGLNMYDYGNRNYDASIGRFMNMDRFAEKYYHLNPYQYGANNPILFNDIKGDSILIYSKQDKTNILYENGNLYSKNSKTGKWDNYNGKNAKVDKNGNKSIGGYLGKATAALDKIRSGNAGAELVGELQKNAKFIAIGEGSNSSGGISGRVSWDPSNTTGGPNEMGSNSRPSYIGLAHELGHAFDGLDGVIDNTLLGAPGMGTFAEYESMHWENRIRGENGLSLRTHYSNDANGNALGQAINSNGSSTRYFQQQTMPTTHLQTNYSSSGMQIVPVSGTTTTVIPFQYR